MQADPLTSSVMAAVFDPQSVKPLAVLLAGLSGFVVGGIWYGPLFSKPWMAANNFNAEDLKRDFSPLKAYGTPAVQPGGGVHPRIVLGTDTTLPRCWIGMVIGLAWVATSFATSYAFERRSNTLLMINAGYHVVEFAAMGAIIGLLQ